MFKEVLLRERLASLCNLVFLLDGAEICVTPALLWNIDELVVQMPAYTIAHNAGVEGAVVVGKLLEQTNLSIGYDAAKGLSLSI